MGATLRVLLLTGCCLLALASAATAAAADRQPVKFRRHLLDNGAMGRDTTTRHLLDNGGMGLGFNAQLRDTTRQEKQAVMAQQIERAAALGANKETISHATARSTRDGADYLGDVAGHLDRRLYATSRRLRDNMGGTETGLQDSLREAATAEARSRIKAAVAGGGARESITQATLRGRAEPLR